MSNSFPARTYSRLGQSGSIFGLKILELKEKGDDIYALSSDMSTVAGLNRFQQKYPNEFVNVGIAEQNLLGISAGVTSEGGIPIAVAQAAFLTMRSFEQMRQYMGYMELPIIAIGIGAGYALTFFGPTHYSIEDLAITRTIPNLYIISPSDAGQAVKAFEEAVKLKRPIYMRLSGGLNCPIIYKEDFDYQIGKAIVLEEGQDIQLIATGLMVSSALKVAVKLKEQGYSVEVVDMHTIKPLDLTQIKNGYKLIVTIEEHSIIGGLGGAVAEVMTGKGISTSLLRIGVNDKFIKPGDIEYMFDKSGLSVDKIFMSIQERLSR